MIPISLDINPASFSRALRARLANSNESLPDSVRSVTTSLLERQFKADIKKGLLYAAKVVIRPEYDKQHPISLREAAGRSEGWPLWYMEIILDAPKKTAVSERSLKRPRVLPVESFEYGPGNRMWFQFRKFSQVTKNRFTFRISKPVIPSAWFKKADPLGNKKCACPSQMLEPHLNSCWEWWLTYVCRRCGASYMCSCFRRAVKLAAPDAQKQSKHYADFGWPHRFLKALKSEFRPKICHMCTGTPSSLFFCSTMYGSHVLSRYGPYVRKLEIEKGLSSREAENKIRERIGVPRIGEGWINETHLYQLIRMIFSTTEVLREASPDWLGRQRLDIFVPELKLAIEYQGEQHSRPVGRFGGEEGFKKVQNADRIKRELCESNGIDLIYFHHFESLDERMVVKRLSGYLKGSPPNHRIERLAAR